MGFRTLFLRLLGCSSRTFEEDSSDNESKFDIIDDSKVIQVSQTKADNRTIPSARPTIIKQPSSAPRRLVLQEIPPFKKPAPPLSQPVVPAKKPIPQALSPKPRSSLASPNRKRPPGPNGKRVHYEASGGWGTRYPGDPTPPTRILRPALVSTYRNRKATAGKNRVSFDDQEEKPLDPEPQSPPRKPVVALRSKHANHFPPTKALS